MKNKPPKTLPRTPRTTSPRAFARNGALPATRLARYRRGISPGVNGTDAFSAHTIQALSATSQPLTGLTWTSSDPTIVSLSTSDPPILSAVAAGHVTITAGTGSADVTVWDPTLLPGGALPLGTVIWSNPGDGSGVQSIVPAVPSTSGVADVFAFQADGTVQAITSSGTTAWTADVSNAWPVLPDFQGGLVAVNFDPNTYVSSIYKLDGITGQPYPAYMPPSNPDGTPQHFAGVVAAHPDGTVFAIQSSGEREVPDSVIGIDPTTGTQKFSVPIAIPAEADAACGYAMIIAGDGYAYVSYEWNADYALDYMTNHLRVLRINSDGASDVIPIMDWASGFSEICDTDASMITNADTGIALAFSELFGSMQPHLAITSGTGVSLMNGPEVADSIRSAAPVLQAQDGSFVGTVLVAADPYAGPFQTNMVAFDATGGTRWIVPNDTPQIATADGGVIGQSGITYDQNGNVTGQVPLFTQSWTLNEYADGPLTQLVANPYLFALSYWPFPEGNDSDNGSAHFPIDSTTNSAVKKILSPQRWQKFAGSNCSAIFSKGLPLPSYSVQVVQTKQGMTNYYDVSNPGVGDLTELQVTGGQYGTGVTLTNYLTNGGADGATVNMGYSKQTAVIMKHKILAQQYPEFDLVHETLLHAYAAQWDDAIFGNSFFQQNGLWRPSGTTATINITTWMSTDCTCTPGNPAAPTCKANTAKW